MSVIGELLVEINGDNSGLKKSLSDSGSAVTSGVGKMVSAIGLASLAWKGVDLAMKGIDYNKAAEQAEIAFGSFLGSATAAKDMIEKLRDLAKETPLEFAEVRDAAKQLSAFGISAENIIPTMRRLADVSAGLNIPVKDLSYLYGTIATQGRAMTVDINQFANRGIKIWENLAAVMGVNVTEMRKMVEQGKVGFPEVEKAFQRMTSQGGDFFNMAVKQMDSLAGSQSNLNDAFDVWLGHMTEALTGPLKDFNKFGANMLNWMVDVDKQYNIIIAQTDIWAAHLFGIKKSSQEIRDDAFVQAKTWDLMNQRGKAYLDNKQKQAEEAKKAKEEAERLAKIEKDRLDTNESLKQEYISQYGTYVQFVTSARERMGIEAENARKKEISDAKEATGRQIVLGYQNAAINAQIRAIGLEKDYQDKIEKTAKPYKDIEDSLKYAGTQFDSLARSMAKFGNDELSKLVQGFADIANDASDLVGALGKGDYVAAAVSGIALIADAWSQFFGGRSAAEKKADEERRKAEEERIAAVKSLEKEYQAKFDSDIVRLQKERDERVAYARKIGADILQIEAYYAGEIEKVRRTTADISIESGRVEEEKRKIKSKYDGLIGTINANNLRLTNAMDAGNPFAKFGYNWSGNIAEAIARAQDYVNRGYTHYQETLNSLLSLQSSTVSALGASAISALTTQMQEELGQVVYNLQLFEERAQGATQGIGQSLVEGLKSGATIGDFRKTIMDMLRNMAIEAAVIAGGFQEKFKEIGVMIAEALKDGFSETELAAIDLRVNALYSQATNAIQPLNDLFAKASASQNIINNAGTTINIQTTNDPLTIANALGNVQQSLAYQGVVA